MRLKLIILTLTAAAAMGVPRTAVSDMSLGVTSTDKGLLSSFHLAIGDFYDVPQERLVVVTNRNLPDDELAVVFFVSDRARVQPDIVIGLRQGGQSWMQICLKYGITAEAFYVPVSGDPGPPYGKAYGHYKKRDKSSWKEIRLSDAEIINFANLKFVSGHYRLSPEEVIRARGAGSSFVTISSDIEKKRTVSQSKSKDSEKPGKKK